MEAQFGIYSFKMADLQKKVQIIAIICIALHVIGFVGEVIQYLTSGYSGSSRYKELLESRTIISIISELLVGLATSILLYVGAKKKKKYLLIPFLLIIVFR